MTVWKQRSPKSRWSAEALARLGFLLVSALTAAKGIIPATHDDELYFWFANYQHGLTRRALVGSLLTPIVDSMTRDQLGILLRLIVLAVFAIILPFTWRWLIALRGQFPERTIYLFASLFVTSPFLGLLAYHVGYPDGLIALLVILGALALRHARIWTFACVLVAGTFVHELILLLLLPLSAWGAINCRHWSRKHYLILALLVVGCCLVVISEGRASPGIIESLTSHLKAVGVPQESAVFQVRASLTQGVSQTILLMRQIWANNLLNAILETIYAALPGVLILSAALPNLSRRIAGRSRLVKIMLSLLFLMSGLGPVFLLALAFDTSRLASFSTLTALLTVGLLFSADSADRGNSRLTSAYVLAAIAYLAFPILDLHPWYAQAINIRRVSPVCGPCARAGLGIADFINRRRTSEERAVFDTNPDYGN